MRKMGTSVLEYSHVDANDGYYVVVYKGSDRLLSVYTDVDEGPAGAHRNGPGPGRASGSMPRSRRWAAYYEQHRGFGVRRQ